MTEERAERLSPLTIIADAWIAIVAALLAGGRKLFRSLTTGEPLDLNFGIFIGFIFLLALAASTAFSGIKWATTRFQTGTETFQVDSGWLFKSAKKISYQRIHAVDIRQPLAARLLGLVRLSLDAGDGETIQLAFLNRQRATELRDWLLARGAAARDGIRPPSDIHNAGPTLVTPPTAAPVLPPPLPPATIVKVPPIRLLQGALLSNTVLLWGIFLPILLGVSLILPEWQLLELVFRGGIFAVVVAVGVYLWQTIIPKWNFTLSRGAQGLGVAMGATDLVTTAIPTARIQSITITQPVIWRWLGKYRVDYSLLSRIGDEQQGHLLLPIGTWDETQNAIAAVWPDLSFTEDGWHRPSSEAKWLSPFAFSWLGYQIQDDFVLVRTGWLWQRTMILRHERVLGTAVQQGPLARWAGVADLALYIPGGHRAVIYHVPETEARQLAEATTRRARELAGRVSRGDSAATGHSAP